MRRTLLAARRGSSVCWSSRRASWAPPPAAHTGSATSAAPAVTGSRLPSRSGRRSSRVRTSTRSSRKLIAAVLWRPPNCSADRARRASAARSGRRYSINSRTRCSTRSRPHPSPNCANSAPTGSPLAPAGLDPILAMELEAAESAAERLILADVLRLIANGRFSDADAKIRRGSVRLPIPAGRSRSNAAGTSGGAGQRVVPVRPDAGGIAEDGAVGPGFGNRSRLFRRSSSRPRIRFPRRSHGRRRWPVPVLVLRAPMAPRGTDAHTVAGFRAPVGGTRGICRRPKLAGKIAYRNRRPTVPHRSPEGRRETAGRRGRSGPRRSGAGRPAGGRARPRGSYDAADRGVRARRSRSRAPGACGGRGAHHPINSRSGSRRRASQAKPP